MVTMSITPTIISNTITIPMSITITFTVTTATVLLKESLASKE